MRSVQNYTVQLEADKPALKENQIGSTVYVKTAKTLYLWAGKEDGWKKIITF